MDKSIHKTSNNHYSPGINPWAIGIRKITKTILMVYFNRREMDKSIQISLLSNHSPRFKPWAMKMRGTTQNRFNGLKDKNKIIEYATFI